MADRVPSFGDQIMVLTAGCDECGGNGLVSDGMPAQSPEPCPKCGPGGSGWRRAVVIVPYGLMAAELGDAGVHFTDERGLNGLASRNPWTAEWRWPEPGEWGDDR